MNSLLLLTLLVGVAFLAGCTPSEPDQTRSDGYDPVAEFGPLPDEVIPILPKDAIPAIFEPEFANADTANIEDNAFVIGVALNGEARAYSRNLLDLHEIVNDVVGGQKIAVTW